MVANAETTARLREQGGLAGMLGSSAVAPFEADGPEAFVWARDLATRLRAAGYRYVGAGSTFAFLQAIGMLSPTAHPGGVADGTRTSDAPTPAVVLQALDLPAEARTLRIERLRFYKAKPLSRCCAALHLPSLRFLVFSPPLSKGIYKICFWNC